MIYDRRRGLIMCERAGRRGLIMSNPVCMATQLTDGFVTIAYAGGHRPGLPDRGDPGLLAGGAHGNPDPLRAAAGCRRRLRLLGRDRPRARSVGADRPADA